MKAAIVLIGVSLSAVAGAQVRGAAQPSTLPAQNIAGNVRMEDPQIAQLKKQVAEIRQQLADIKEKNSQLSYCVSHLQHEVDALKHPKPSKDDDGVTIQPPQGIGVTGCD